MSDSATTISIRFSIDIPVGVTVTVQEEKPKQAPAKVLFLDPYVVSTDPAINAVKPVRPTANSGLGTLCASVTFNQTVYNVTGKVYPEPNATPSSAPPQRNIVTAVNTSGNTWVWNDPNSNPLPYTNYYSSAPYPANTFVFWYTLTQTSDWILSDPVPFQGQTGTAAPCGTGVGFAMTPLQQKTFPAVWLLEISGFSGPDAIFNNLHGLRSHRSAAMPTWDNQGDGTASPRIELHYTPQGNQWVLTVKQGKLAFTSTAVSASLFGPLSFTVGQAGVGLQSIPQVIATAV